MLLVPISMAVVLAFGTVQTAPAKPQPRRAPSARAQQPPPDVLPVQDTVEGEPVEIFPFLGCSRLEEPLTRYPVSVVFHGHAHHGRPEGRTRTNAPVYNVSISMMRERSPCSTV